MCSFTLPVISTYHNREHFCIGTQNKRLLFLFVVVSYEIYLIVHDKIVFLEVFVFLPCDLVDNRILFKFLGYLLCGACLASLIERRQGLRDFLYLF